MSNGTEKNDTAPASPWLTVDQAAVYAQVSARTLYRECRAGRLRHARVGGRREVRIRCAWIDGWLEQSAEPIEVRRG